MAGEQYLAYDSNISVVSEARLYGNYWSLLQCIPFRESSVLIMWSTSFKMQHVKAVVAHLALLHTN